MVLRYESHHKPQTTLIDGNKIRFEEPDEVLIFDGEAKQLITLNTAKKTYGLTTQQEMREAGERLRASIKKLKEHTSNLTPTERKQLEEALAAVGGSDESKSGGESARKSVRPPESWKPLGEARSVAGFSCQMYARRQGKVTDKQCLIPWGVGVVRRADLAVLQKFAEFYTEPLGGMRDDLKEAGKQMMAEFTDAPGFAALIERENGEVTSELKGLERTDIPSDKFSVPAGYTKTGHAGRDL